MTSKRKPFSRRLSSFFSSGSQSLDEDSTKKTQHQSVAELERKVEELTSKCANLETKLKKEQSKCSEWKKQMVHVVLQKHESSSITNTRKPANSLLGHRKYVSEDNLLEPAPSTSNFYLDNNHPLQNEKVVRHLLQFLKKEDLYRGRLVCTIWNWLGKREIAKRVDAHIHLDNVSNMRKFQQVKQLRPSGDVFYQNFHFHYASHSHSQNCGGGGGGAGDHRRSSVTPVETCPNENRTEFTKTMQIIAAYTKKLTLAYTDSQILEAVFTCCCPELETLNLAVGIPLLSSCHDLKHAKANPFPKLKVLSFTLHSTRDHRLTDKHEENFLHVFKLLLSLSHATLSKLTVTIVGSLVDEAAHFGNVLAQSLLKLKPARLSELHLSSFPIEKRLVAEILNSRFEFKALGVGFIDWKSAYEILPLLYRTKPAAAKLQRLCVHVHCRCDSTSEWLNSGLDDLITNGFSYMRLLTTFDVIPTKFLAEGKYRFERLHPTQSHYLVKPIVGVPVLKSIEIEPHHAFKDIKTDASPLSTPEVQHKVNRFRFVHTLVLKREPAASEMLRKCAKLLSISLTKLEFVPHDSNALVVVWNGLPNLEELKIHPTTDAIPDLEAVIIGMNASDCKKLREDPTIAILIGMTEGKTLKHLQSLPSIRLLRKLRSFDAGNEKYLTDLSVLLAFVKMKTLTALKFRFKGSYSTIRLLRSEIPGIYVDSWK